MARSLIRPAAKRFRTGETQRPKWEVSVRRVMRDGKSRRMIKQCAAPRPYSVLVSVLATFFIIFTFGSDSPGAFAQKKPKQRTQRPASLTSHSRESLSPEARELAEMAVVAVCTERLSDPKGSVPIDDMQARPSLPVQSPEAVAGAKRAQRLLTIAKGMVVLSLKRLARDYGFRNPQGYDARLQRAIARVEAVRNIRPDMDSRDNASVFLRNPHPSYSARYSSSACPQTKE